MKDKKLENTALGKTIIFTKNFVYGEDANRTKTWVGFVISLLLVPIVFIISFIPVSILAGSCLTIGEKITDLIKSFYLDSPLYWKVLYSTIGHTVWFIVVCLITSIPYVKSIAVDSPGWYYGLMYLCCFEISLLLFTLVNCVIVPFYNFITGQLKINW